MKEQNMDISKQNVEMKERYDLAIERVELILGEDSVKEPYRDYFTKVASFIMQIRDLVSLIQKNELKDYNLEDLKKLNYELYQDIEGSHYESSYANPAYAKEKLGENYGEVLTFLYTEIRGMIAYAYEKRLFDIVIHLELFIEVYNYFENEGEYTYKDVKSAIYYFVSDYSDMTVEYRTRELLDPSLSFATDIIMNSDLTDVRYLYQFGEYITENEIKIATFLNSLSEDEIDSMASTFTEGYRMGFENAKIDLSKKTTVNIRYCIGFERIVRKEIENFKRMNLNTTIYRAAVNSINKRQHLKIGYFSTSPNKQYDYDHRFDNGLYLDKAFNERKLSSLRVAYEKNKELAKGFAGPAVMEIFGEQTFAPLSKPECIHLDEKQQKLSVAYSNDAAMISSEYINNEETSFTIIAYPIPEIGDQFAEIFAEVVKVNTLDNDKYKKIQQSIIDALDEGDYVSITGANGNHTNINVKLYELQDKEKETIFENCTADVNIPVGEVFTSPVLKGTSGTLHVKKVYLRDLKYIDLDLQFEDGMIKDYTCKNYEDDVENKKYVKENLLHNHDTLPIGEFAIGTNTTAYVMAEKYHISDKLPILIAEKTGPHFAVGDTCYSRSEEVKLYNPDGKEIVAKENECSRLRTEDKSKAYFNCHTDITIPYHELGDIIVHKKNEETITIVKDGRFVLAGTEELNEAFK
ncbi:aminopeptidase [Anaeromicropila herbilytica]|uniref:Leucyl aminopeptidase n=1 Tax=Anaeromicropila herbilytica TaxID=2785025 RepID=A0A7R7EJG3_9FIRM|nr:aminopeptidase [Anaeromicropila herbilytica]BCN29834.1 hypothetical protein bsdtb5_11290 [Anaeromicropila herbilytica]